MITVHHLEKSRSTRVLWLLEELDLPYEIVTYRRNPQTMLAPPELKKIHPLGKSPIVKDDDRTLVESGAILEYLVERHGEGRLLPPPGSDERLRYTRWMHYAEGSLMPPLLLKLVFETTTRKAPWPIKPIAKAIAGTVLSQFVEPQIATHFDHVESELGRSTWFAGDTFTAADIQVSYPIEAYASRAMTSPHPNISKYLERIHARPAYRRAIEKGGPVTLG